MKEKLGTKAVGFYFTVLAALLGIISVIRFVMWGSAHDTLDTVTILALIVAIVLDIILIGGFGMGVGAAAAATIISQALSSAMCFLRLIRSPFPIGIRIASMRIHRQELRNIVRFGFPAGFQNIFF